MWAVVLTMVVIGPNARGQAQTSKLDPMLLARVGQLTGQSKVVVTAPDAASLPAVGLLIQQVGGTLGPLLEVINSQAATVPNAALATLANSASVSHVALDRLLMGALERTGSTIGASAVRQTLGLTGAGIGVAVIDSGIMAWHDDLTDQPGTGPRIARFVDFVAGAGTAIDDNGHGTHVAGIIAGTGYDSGGARMGIAPGAH
ncbi:MAG: S8 family serine peptidase, partial [Gaiellales bacterium]